MVNRDGSNEVDELLGVQMKSQLKCLECDEEPPSLKTETQRILFCHLGTQTEPVSHVGQGIQLSLKEHIEKNSTFLGRTAQYEKSSAISRLPPYLMVQYARFGYKAANAWAGTAASKVKITRKIAFSPTLDLIDMLDDELKPKVQAGRRLLKDQEDAKVDLARKRRLEGGDEDVEMKSAEDVEMGETHDVGSYELIAIVSHKGRTADGGHYVGWARSQKADGKTLKEDRWLSYDDESVFGCGWKDFVGYGTDLQGGKPDTQIAYISIYKKLTVTEDPSLKGAIEAMRVPAPEPEKK